MESVRGKLYIVYVGKIFMYTLVGNKAGKEGKKHELLH